MKKNWKYILLVCMALALTLLLCVHGMAEQTEAETVIKVGNVVTYGHYEQDNDTVNGEEPIEWVVLDVQGNKALLISKYGLDAQPYNTEYKDITWEKCTLRSWLNSTFLNAAFTAEEQKGILTTAVDNSKSQGYSVWDTDGGNNTQDQIFLLSYAEVNKYFKVTNGGSNNIASRVAPTAYAIGQGAYTWSGVITSEGKDAGWWWLRSPGYCHTYASYVYPGGSIYNDYVFGSGMAVRPAFWLDLDERDYQTAKVLLETGKYAEAYAVYAGLKGYKDVDNILSSDENLMAAAAAHEAAIAPFKKVGNVVTFGNYEQDNNKNNGKEPIEWIVLDVQGNNALLISKYGLDAQPYNTQNKVITWEKCTLRSWLNSTFLRAAFTTEEQKGILTTAVDNSEAQGYSGYSTNGGNNTKDKIFLLSYAEANKYFGVQHYSVDGAKQNTSSRVAPTAYAIAQGVSTRSDYKTSEGKAAGWWWLRSPGNNKLPVACVDPYGSLDPSPVSISDWAVRPAFWLDLESGIF